MNFDKVPRVLKQNLVDVHGADAIQWLQQLPSLIRSLAEEWKFEPLEVIPNLTFSYVISVEGPDSSPAILKLTPPNSQMAAEIRWYEANPVGTAKLLSADFSRGALLLERLQPGRTLKALVQEGRDDEATVFLAQAINQLRPRSEDANKFKHVSELAADFRYLHGVLDSTVVVKANAIFQELAKDRSKDLPLHGDIHHDNVLQNGDGWLVIDPHGYSGPKAFEVGAMLHNPYDGFPSALPARKIVARRLQILEENLPFDREEIRAWAFAYTVLSAAWTASTGRPIPSHDLEIIETLAQFI